MPETCENWLGLACSYVYYARQTREFYQLSYLILSYLILGTALVDFKAPGELSKCSIFKIKYLQTSETTMKLKNNLYTRLYFFLIFTVISSHFTTDAVT